MYTAAAGSDNRRWRRRCVSSAHEHPSGVAGAGTDGEVTLAIDDGVGTIEFSHPKGNSLPGALLRELAEGVELLGESDDARVIVLGSGGSGPFCAGASFDELVAIENERDG